MSQRLLLQSASTCFLEGTHFKVPRCAVHTASFLHRFILHFYILSQAPKAKAELPPLWPETNHCVRPQLLIEHTWLPPLLRLLLLFRERERQRQRQRESDASLLLSFFHLFQSLWSVAGRIVLAARCKFITHTRMKHLSVILVNRIGFADKLRGIYIYILDFVFASARITPC